MMITGADLRDDAQRNGQKNNDPEPSRFKKLMKMEGVDVDCLQTLGRYGSKLAILFHTSLGAQKFMQDFKKIKPAGATGPRSPRIAPPPDLPVHDRGPSRKHEGIKKDSLSCLHRAIAYPAVCGGQEKPTISTQEAL